jgi:hypothetical protein
MPQDAPLSQRNNAVASNFHGSNAAKQVCCSRDQAGLLDAQLFHVMRVVVPRPVMRVMAPRMVIWGRVRLHRRGLGRRVALVLLRGAHRPHRQFETRIAFDIGCRGKRWNEENEGAGRDQAGSATKHDVHDEGSRKQWITPTSFYHNLRGLTG